MENLVSHPDLAWEVDINLQIDHQDKVLEVLLNNPKLRLNQGQRNDWVYQSVLNQELKDMLQPKMQCRGLKQLQRWREVQEPWLQTFRINWHRLRIY